MENTLQEILDNIQVLNKIAGKHVGKAHIKMRYDCGGYNQELEFDAYSFDEFIDIVIENNFGAAFVKNCPPKYISKTRKIDHSTDTYYERIECGCKIINIRVSIQKEGE